MFRRVIALLLCGFSTALALPTAPPDPAVWNVHVRYQIFAFRTERLRQYAEMAAALKAARFERDPDEEVAENEPENPRATRLRGTVPAASVNRLLGQRHIRALLLYPKDTTLPAKGTRIRVDLRLVSGYLTEVQRRLATQTAAVLSRDAGLVEAVGYDRAGDTRLLGSVPAENLDRLLEDIRHLPSAPEQGQPLMSVSSVRLIYARPDWPVPTGRPKAADVPEPQRKFAPELVPCSPTPPRPASSRDWRSSSAGRRPTMTANGGRFLPWKAWRSRAASARWSPSPACRRRSRRCWPPGTRWSPSVCRGSAAPASPARRASRRRSGRRSAPAAWPRSTTGAGAARACGWR